MNWLDELDALLNNTSIEELEKKWSKYNEFDFGPELETLVKSSIDFYYGQLLQCSENVIYQGNMEYSQDNEYALAA